LAKRGLGRFSEEHVPSIMNFLIVLLSLHDFMNVPLEEFRKAGRRQEGQAVKTRA